MLNFYREKRTVELFLVKRLGKFILDLRKKSSFKLKIILKQFLVKKISLFSFENMACLFSVAVSCIVLFTPFFFSIAYGKRAQKYLLLNSKAKLVAKFKLEYTEVSLKKGWFFKNWPKNYRTPTLRDTQYSGLNSFIHLNIIDI